MPTISAPHQHRTPAHKAHRAVRPHLAGGTSDYRALFPDLRNEFTAAAKQARDAGLGVWASDATTTGADVTGLTALEDDIVIVPKLFRRLVDYLHLGDNSMAGFPAFLDQAADKFFILSTGHSTTGLDAVLEVTGNNVKMTRPIEDLVFDEK